MNEPRRPRVDPQLLFGISLIIGLFLAWPSLSSAMKGNSDIVAAGIRLLLSIGVAWTGCFLVSTLIGGYAREIDVRESDQERQRVEAQTSIDRRSPEAPSQGGSATNSLAAPALNQLPQATSTDSEPAPYSSTTTS